MKSLFQTITANDEGELLLEIGNDKVKVRTQFSNLGRPVWRALGQSTVNVSSYFDLDSGVANRNKSRAGRGECKTATVTVDIKRVYQLINSIKVIPDKLVCSMFGNELNKK